MAGQPNVGTELRREIASADSVDLICAFVIWSGVRQLRDALAELVERGGTLRQCVVAGRPIDWNELSTGGRSLLVRTGRLAAGSADARKSREATIPRRDYPLDTGLLSH